MSDTKPCPSGEADPGAATGSGGGASPVATPTPDGPSAGLRIARWLAGVALAVAALYLGTLWLFHALMSFHGGGNAAALGAAGALVAVLVAVNLWLHRTGAGSGAAGHAGPPAVVSVARVLAVLAIAVFTPVLCYVGLIVMDDGPSSTIPNMVAWAMACALLVLHGWLVVALGRRRPAGWWILSALAGLWAVFGFPIGTVVAGLLLYWWVKPATKAWFSLPGRR